MNVHFSKSGIPVLIHKGTHFNSVSIGVYVRVSIPQEPAEYNGIAHFLEHMSFKGTPTRSAKKIAQAVDAMGGHINAHTAKEYTCYYITCLPQSITKALDILADIYIHSTLKEDDIAMERNVILEEINMVEDNPEDHVHDLFCSTIWKNNALGLPILGTKDTLMPITHDVMAAFKAHYLNPKNMIISVAGKIRNTDRLLSSIESAFQFTPTPLPSHDTFTRPCSPNAITTLLHKQTEQVHFCLGGPAISNTDPRYAIYSILNTVLGGSMSSRLFQEIREKKGLAYSVYSYLSLYQKSGYWTIYGGVNATTFHPALQIVLREMHRLAAKPISASELRKAKSNLKGSITLGLERSSAWMGWMAKSFMYHERIRTTSELLADIDAVTIADVQALATELFHSEAMSMAAIGPFENQIEIPTSEYMASFRH